jgi:hypothetical protein
LEFLVSGRAHYHQYLRRHSRQKYQSVWAVSVTLLSTFQIWWVVKFRQPRHGYSVTIKEMAQMENIVIRVPRLFFFSLLPRGMLSPCSASVPQKVLLTLMMMP